MSELDQQFNDAATLLRNRLLHPSLFSVNQLVEAAEEFVRLGRKVLKRPRP